MAAEDITTKRCTKCGESKSLDEFYISSKRKDGICPHCKTCMKAYSAKYRVTNPDKVKATSAAWRAANPEKQKAAHSAWDAANADRKKASLTSWRAANQDKIKASNSAWTAANADRVRAVKAAWHAANRDRRNSAKIKWYAANPEARRIYNQNRRARVIASGGRLSRGITKRLLTLQRGKCACCGKPLGDDYHLDHIMPLALGGTNTDDNMQLLTRLCNQQKKAKHPVEFMRQRGFLL